jgi:hypothetical protein
MSGNQQSPDIMCEVFILDPTDLVDATELGREETAPSKVEASPPA